MEKKVVVTQSSSLYFSRMKWLKRVYTRLRFIITVSHRMGADLSSKCKMMIGGIWLLINDSWKSSLHFSAQICHDGKITRFYFEDAADFELLDEVFLKCSYNFPGPFPDTPLIIDLGANIGVSTLFFALKWPDSTIHSVEPDPENFRRLKMITESLPQVILHNVAVWSETGTISFYRDTGRGSSSSVSPAGLNREQIEISAVTLSDLLEQTGAERVSLLKFDVEGAEQEIFAGFKDFQIIERLAGELHYDLCDTTVLLVEVKKFYNSIFLNPLKKQREYLQAFNIS